jgi:uncharacterized protein YodC (DUF2158 family)
MAKLNVNVGDKIRITDAVMTGGKYCNGDILTVETVGKDVVFVEEHGIVMFNSEFEVITKDAIEPGTKIRITKPFLAGGYGKGDVLTVESYQADSEIRYEGVKVEETNDFIRRTEFEIIEEQSFKTGDKVRLVSGGGRQPLFGYTDGETYEVFDLNYELGGEEYISLGKVGFAFGSGYAKPHQIELVGADEADEADEGSKDQVKVGDIVKATKCLDGTTAGAVGWGRGGQGLVSEGASGSVVKVLDDGVEIDLDDKDTDTPDSFAKSKFFLRNGEFEVIAEAPKFKTGDKVKLLSGAGVHPLAGTRNGETYTIKAMPGEYSLPFARHSEKGLIQLTGGVEDSSTHAYASPEQLELVEDRAEGPKGFQVGDLVKVTDKLHGHKFRIGETVRVTQLDSNGELYKAENLDGSDYWFIADEEVEPALAEETKLEVGDRVKVETKSKYGYIKAGSTGKVQHVDFPTESGHRISVVDDSGTQGLFLPESVVKIVEEEPKAGKFQSGDIVLVSAGYIGGARYGEVISGPKGSIAGGNYRVDNGKEVEVVLGDHLTMIAPKANRVD